MDEDLYNLPGELMDKLRHLPGIFMLIYSSFMIYKGPNLADALIVLTLAFASVSLNYIYKKFSSNEETFDTTELKKLELEIKEAQLRESLENVKFQSAQQQSIRDERRAADQRPRGSLF